MLLRFVALFLLVTGGSNAVLCAQVIGTPPSAEEIGELVAKADQVVTAYERALDAVKTSGIEKTQYSSFTAAPATARTIISDIKRTGPSAYSLTALVATLDDSRSGSLLASNLILLSMITAEQDRRTISDASVLAPNTLTNSAASIGDISELILHATLRLVGNEERALVNVSEQLK